MINLSLFLTFFKIGALTFGGGYAMIPMIQAEIVSRGWATLEQLIDYIAVSESTPGPFAVNSATLIGMNQGGLVSAFFATLGVVLPSFLIMLLIAKFFYSGFSNNRIVTSALSGLRPVVVGLIASAAVSIVMTVLFHVQAGMGVGAVLATFNWRGALITALMFGLSLWKKKAHPIVLILLSAGLGIVLFGFLGGA